MKALGFLCGALATAGAALAQGVDGSGIIVLNRHADSALELSGNSTVHIATRAVYVNSDSAQALRTVGTAVLDVPRLNIVGGTSFSSNSHVTGEIVRGGAPVDNPLSSLQFPSSQGMTPLAAVSISGGSVTVQPGYYANGFQVRGNADVTFAPGMYFFGNGLKITAGRITGRGVCFVMLGGTMDIGGTSSFLLSPPESGDWTGMVISQPAANASDMNIAGGGSFVLMGAIYAPAARACLTGSSSSGEGPHMGDLVIADRVKLSGTADIVIGGGNLQAVVPPRMPLYD